MYEPHIAPRLELWAAEFIEHRRARRMRQRGPTAVPVSIPLLRRHGDNHSEHSSSDSDPGPDMREDDSHSRDLRQPSDLFTTSARVTGFDPNVTHEGRSEVGQSQLSNNLRHRTNRHVHAMDEVRVFFFFKSCFCYEA